MPFRFYIDGQLTNPPDNDSSLITSIKRNGINHSMTMEQNGTLKYSGENAAPAGTTSGYTILKNLYDSGTCETTEIIISDEQSPTDTFTLFRGIIKVPNIQVDYQAVSVSVAVDDNNYDAYINNNKNIPFNLYAELTKNQEPVTPPSIYEVDLFNSYLSTYGSTIGLYARGYRLYDVLSFLISAISDNKVSFYTDFLKSLDTELFIFDGYAIAHPNNDPNISVSFQQIVDELYKLYGVGFYINSSDPANPVLTLEREQDLYNGIDVIDFNDYEIKELKSQIKAERLYGTVNVGSSFNPGGPNTTIYTFNAGTSYFGWKEEVYTPFGQCNTDNELDLVNDFYISSNAVNDQAVGVTTENFDDIFLVECYQIDDGAFTAVAYPYLYGTSGYYFYNLGLNNVSKMDFHTGSFQSAVSNTLQTSGDICHISKGSDEAIADQAVGALIHPFNTPIDHEPIIFTDEFGGGNYDPGGNYHNINGHYECPQDGDYSFSTSIHAEFENIKAGTVTQVNITGVGTFNAVPGTYGWRAVVKTQVYQDNTFGSLIDSKVSTYIVTANGTPTITQNYVASLLTGNCVRTDITLTWFRFLPTLLGASPLEENPTVLVTGFPFYSSNEPKARVIVLEDSVFQCSGAPGGGLVFATSSPSIYKARTFNFEYSLSSEDQRLIMSLPTGRFQFTKDGQSRYGWIDELQINNWTGKASVKLVTEDASA